MNILDLIRERLTTRHGDARSKYWATVAKLVQGDMSDRAAAAAADTLEGLLPALGKTIDDVQRDIDTLTEFRATEAAAAQHAQARIRAKDAARAGVEVEAQAREFEERAKALREKHAAEVHAARATMQAGDGAESRLAELRNRLAAAGFPDAVAAAEHAKGRREVDRLEGELRTLDPELREAEAAAASPRAVGLVDPQNPPRNHRAESRASTLRIRRAEIVQRIQALRCGAVIAEVENVETEADSQVMP